MHAYLYVRVGMYVKMYAFKLQCRVPSPAARELNSPMPCRTRGWCPGCTLLHVTCIDVERGAGDSHGGREKKGGGKGD